MPDEVRRGWLPKTSQKKDLGLGVGEQAEQLGVVHAWVGQIVTFFAYSPPSRPLGSPTPTQPGRVTNPTRGCPGALWEAPQEVCWLLGREPKPPA